MTFPLKKCSPGFNELSERGPLNLSRVALQPNGHNLIAILPYFPSYSLAEHLLLK